MKNRAKTDTGNLLRLWAEYLTWVRQFFVEQQFIEVNTPTRVLCPGSEPFLDFFEVDGCFLPPSPEYGLKKILAWTQAPIFEIRTCFRKEPSSPLHRSEFFMLEWYSPGIGWEGFQNQVIHLLQKTWQRVGHPSFSVQKARVDELFARWVGLELRSSTSAQTLESWCVQNGYPQVRGWSFDDLFHFIFLERIQPVLKDQDLVLVTHYPPSQAALAQLDSDGWALRFEVFFRGIELGNAYEELCDLDEYRMRFATDNKNRQALGRNPVPVDAEFEEALKLGWPPGTCGIAFGLERWFMLLHQQQDIHSWFPLFRS